MTNLRNLIKKPLSGRIHKREEAETLYEEITILEKENQCLKNEIKNEQAVIEMLITGNKSGKEWKAVKNDKIKRNTTITSASSMLSKVPSPVTSPNWSSSLMVAEESSTEHESQIQTPTNYHQHIENQNTKSKSRPEKSKFHSMKI